MLDGLSSNVCCLETFSNMNLPFIFAVRVAAKKARAQTTSSLLVWKSLRNIDLRAYVYLKLSSTSQVSTPSGLNVNVQFKLKSRLQSRDTSCFHQNASGNFKSRPPL